VALFEAQKDAVNLVIVDLIMPEMDGIAVLEEILRIRAETPVLLVSGYTRESERVEALKDRSSSVRFLAKPYQPERLVAVVKQLLAP
jgi:DNA-binding response OmpR family regulator